MCTSGALRIFFSVALLLASSLSARARGEVRERGHGEAAAIGSPGQRLQPSAHGQAQRIRAAIDRTRAAADTEWLPAALHEFYAAHGFQPVWSNATGWLPLASRFLRAESDLRAHGLQRVYVPPPTRALVTSPQPPAALPQRALADVTLSAAFMLYSRDFGADCLKRAGQRFGKLDDSGSAPARLLTDALRRGGAWFLFLDRFPRAAAYHRLLQALVRYERLEQSSAFLEIPAGEELLRIGDEAASVRALRSRLRLTRDLSGPLAAPHAAAVYDEKVEAAVKRFQARHGLATDGIVGRETLEALNVPLKERVRQLQLNLKRWGCLPDSFGDSFLLVNVPEFTLRAYRQGAEVLRMPVVVGSRYESRETPLFHDRLEYLVFRPYWNIPQSIVTQEILPKARRDPGYLAQHRYQVAEAFGPNADVIHEVDAAVLARIAAGELRLRQAPGPNNALGRVKFIFPNDFNVYLHDTPKDALFDEAQRAFSHGCIRVERPLELALYALHGTRKDDGTPWSREDILPLMRQGRSNRVYLEDALAVHIVYLTAWVEEDGTVQFSKDIYGYDS